VSKKAKSLNVNVPSKYTSKKISIFPVLTEPEYNTNKNLTTCGLSPYEDDKDSLEKGRRFTFDNTEASNSRKSQRISIPSTKNKILSKNHSTRRGMMVMMQNFTEKQAEKESHEYYKDAKLKVKSENYRKCTNS
jgi:hypothetical protein